MNIDTLIIGRGSGWHAWPTGQWQGLTHSGNDVAGVVRATSAIDYDWSILVILVVLLVLALIFNREFQVLMQRIKGFFSTERTFSIQGGNTTQIGEVRNTLLLTSVSSLSLAMMVLGQLPGHSVLNATLGFIDPKWHLLVLAGLIMLVLYLKGLVYGVVNWVFFEREERRSWLSSYFLLTSLMAFIICPIALVDAFVNSSVQMLAICLLIPYILYEILLFFKLLTNFKTKNSGYLLIFLYFCTVEIVPALVAWHIFSLSRG